MDRSQLEIEVVFNDYLSLESEIPQADKDIVLHYIDHGEYGIALHSAISVYEEGDARLSTRGFEKLMDLAIRMNDESSKSRILLLPRS
jgi:hypothetical protein